jgi:hypothetical protein
MSGILLRYRPIYAQLAEADNLLLPEAGHAMELMADAEKIVTTPADIAAAESTVELTIECFTQARTALQTRGKPIWVEIARQRGSRFDAGVICAMNPPAPDGKIYMAMWLRDARSPKQLLFCPVLISFDLERLPIAPAVPTPMPLPAAAPRRNRLKTWLAARRQYKVETTGRTRLGALRGFLSPGLSLRETDGTIKALRLMADETNDIHNIRDLFCEVALDSSVMVLCCLATFERG